MCPKIYSAYLVYLTAGKKQHDSDEEKEKMQKKRVMTPFQRVCVSNLNKIFFYDNTGAVGNLFKVFPFVPRLDLVLYFPSVNNYLQILTSELGFASF